MNKLLDKNTLIIVANGTDCNIFSIDPQTHMLALQQNFHSDFTRSHNYDLEFYKPGRVHESHSSIRHSIETKIHSKRKEKNKLADQISSFLNQKFFHKKVRSFILIAPPELLGKLRRKLNKDTKSAIIKEIDKDLTNFKEADLFEYLKE